MRSRKSIRCNNLRRSAQLLSQAGDKPFVINTLQALLDHQVNRELARKRGHLKLSMPACASDRAAHFILMNTMIG